jgi:hypothetical protein
LTEARDFARSLFSQREFPTGDSRTDHPRAHCAVFRAFLPTSTNCDARAIMRGASISDCLMAGADGDKFFLNARLVVQFKRLSPAHRV